VSPQTLNRGTMSLFTDNALLQTLGSDTAYTACLILDGGFITGMKLRQFLAGAIVNSPILSELTSSASIDGNIFTFAQLSQANAVKLAVIATNLRTNYPMVFSADTTPKFPVADAVAMSASFPFLFKPTLIGKDFDTGCKDKSSIADYPGFYADGGLTNNVPIHVFDTAPLVCDPLFSSEDPDQKFLASGMLGLRLSPGDPPSNSTSTELSGYQETAVNIVDFGAMVLNALSADATQGQIRTPLEGKQTVNIYSGGLDLLDFVPPADDSVTQGAWRNGWNAMNEYYSANYASPW
jgi:predicted acylesterase/phospholipase RssA